MKTYNEYLSDIIFKKLNEGGFITSAWSGFSLEMLPKMYIDDFRLIIGISILELKNLRDKNENENENEKPIHR